MMVKSKMKPGFKRGGVSRAGAPVFRNRFGDNAEPTAKFKHGGTVHMTHSTPGTCRGTGCAVKGKSTKGCV